MTLCFASYVTTQQIDGRIGRAIASVDKGKYLLGFRVHRQNKFTRRLRMLADSNINAKPRPAESSHNRVAPVSDEMYDLSEQGLLSPQE